MRYEKIIKRADGNSVRITVTLAIDFRDVYWNVVVEFRPKSFKKWQNVHDSNNYIYRRMDIEEREKDILNKQLEFVSAEEILQAKLELWEKLKPTI